MRLKFLAAIAVVTATSLAVPVSAEVIGSLQIAQFPSIRLPGTGGSSTLTPSEPAPTQQEFKGFSGNYTDYSDTYNGYKLKVPTEFKLNDKGATTNWTGPLMDGGSASIYINAAPLKGVASKVVYDANFKSKKEDRNYTEVVPVKVNFGGKTAYAFRCKEANHKPGSPEEKGAGDIHRWHLFVFGNEMVYTMGFTGPYASFKGNKLQATYEAVIKSVELVAIK
jgi:hypothetical protein